VFYTLEKLVYISYLNNLEGEEDQEGNHQTEETHSFGEGKSENSIREQLLFQGWVSGVANDQRTEHRTNTGTGSSDTNGGGTSTNKLSGGVDVLSNWSSSNVSSQAHAKSRGSDKLTGSHFIG
jgi:hypothetical protein